MNPESLGTLVVSLVLAVVLLYWHLWRAVTFIKPTSVRLEIDSPGATQVPGLLDAADTQLRALGFAMIGTHLEHPRFTSALLNYDYAHPEKKTFATLYVGPRDVPKLYFVTATANGGAVLTANYRRPGANQPGRYLSGGLEGAAPDRLFKAHLRRLEEMPAVDTDLSIEGRLAQAAHWFKDIGVGELRQQSAVGLLWTVGAFLIAGMAIYRVL